MIAHILNDQLHHRTPSLPPRNSAFGALLNALTEEKEHFQPTNINFGLFSPLDVILKGKQKKERKRALQIERAQNEFTEWLTSKQFLIN